MQEVLLEHYEKYPEMQIQDVIKLLYQSEFGGGHMIANPQKSLEFLKQEWSEVTACKEPGGRAGDGKVWEFLGEGVYRMYLGALEEGLWPETMNQLFVQTADQKSGSKEAFEKKLQMFLRFCEDGKLPFPAAEVRAYLKGYREQGYPAVSHSPEYRKAYRPAYRVVSDRFFHCYEVFLNIDRVRTAASSQVLVAIDGMCGSGKSTLGRVLKSVYACNLFHMDDYFLRPEQRTGQRLSETGGHVDYERFQEEILDHISDSEGLTYQIYDCKSQSLGKRIFVPRRELAVVEGSYSQHPCFGDVYDLRFFCEVSDREQMERIRLRNGEAMAERFRLEWIPRENAYFEKFQIREKSIRIR